VLYVLNATEAEEIARHRALRVRHLRAGETFSANTVREGDVFPMIIVRTWGEEPHSAVNGKLLLDGEDDYWVTSRVCNPDKRPGTWHWPTNLQPKAP
jgi:hypothetical protein